MFTRTRPRFLYAEDDGTGSGATSGPKGDPPKDPDPKGSPPADPPKGDEPKLTQAEVDTMFDREFGKRKAKWEKELTDYAEREGQTEVDRLKAELADRDKALSAKDEAVLTTKVETRAERLATIAGVKPERVDRFLRLVDLSDLDALATDGKPDDDAITKVIGATLEDVPEFKGAGSGKPSSGGGDFGGAGGAPKQWTRADLAKLSTAEFVEHEDEIMEQMRAGSIS